MTIAYEGTAEFAKGYEIGRKGKTFTQGGDAIHAGWLKGSRDLWVAGGSKGIWAYEFTTAWQTVKRGTAGYEEYLKIRRGTPEAQDWSKVVMTPETGKVFDKAWSGYEVRDGVGMPKDRPETEVITKIKSAAVAPIVLIGVALFALWYFLLGNIRKG